MGAGKAARAAVIGLALMAAWCVVDGTTADAQEETDEEQPPKPPPPPPSTLKVIGAYVLVAGGLLVCTIGAARTLGNPSYAQARLTMTNLLRTNPHQAERVAMTTDQTFYSGIHAAMKTAVMVGSSDPAIVPQCTAPAYDGAGQQVKVYWDGLIRKAKLGGMAAAGGVILAVTSGIGPTLIIIMGALAGIGFARLYLYKLEVESSFTKARIEVLPELDRAIIDGRYVLPPKQ